MSTWPETLTRPTIAQLLDFAAAHPGRHTSNTDMDIRRILRENTAAAAARARRLDPGGVR